MPRPTTAVALLVATVALAASSGTSKTVPVTADNYVRAETDFTLASLVKAHGLGKFDHARVPTPLDRQFVPRQNRDTLYSSAVFDLDAGPVTITLPDPGRRFMSMQAIDEDHYVTLVAYPPVSKTLTREQVRTRYVMVAARILVDPNDPKDLAEVHALQDAIRVEQASPGRLELPVWDPGGRTRIHDALLVLAATLPDYRHAFGTKEQVDPVRHLIATASAWGGNPDTDATYLNVTPARNDGKTVHRLSVKDVPVDGFWSITVYDAKGFLRANKQNAYSVNNITAHKAADGSVLVQFGGCDGKAPNCLPITAGWNYIVRLYRPRAEILDGSWKFPEASP
jgi:hypothetical protein